MARLKTDAERGVFGAWAYNTRILLDVSVEQVASRLPTKYNPATLRKIEGGSTPIPPAKVWRELRTYYVKVATEKKLDIDEQPRLPVEQSASRAEPTDMASALAGLTAELRAIRLEREAWTRGVAEVLRSYADGRVPTELLDALAPQPLEDARP